MEENTECRALTELAEIANDRTDADKLVPRTRCVCHIEQVQVAAQIKDHIVALAEGHNNRY